VVGGGGSPQNQKRLLGVGVLGLREGWWGGGFVTEAIRYRIVATYGLSIGCVVVCGWGANASAGRKTGCCPSKLRNSPKEKKP